MNLNLKLSAPLHIDFEITRRCQLRCDYCSAMPLGGPDTPLVRTLELLEEFKKLGVYSLLITGGEPTVHHHFLRILENAAKSVSSITINTNGLRLRDWDYCVTLNRLAPNALFAISLDSIEYSINDGHRGRGGAQAVQAIRNCAALGMNVCVSSVLTQESLPKADKIIDFFWPAVKQFRFFPQVARNHFDLFKTPEGYHAEITNFFKRVSGLASVYPGIHLLTPIGDIGIEPRTKTQATCLCGSTRVYINNNLDVFPCFYSAANHNKLGSLSKDTLSDVWHGENAHRLQEQYNLCEMDKRSIPVRYAKA